MKLQVHCMLSHRAQINSANLLDVSSQVLYTAYVRIANQLWKEKRQCSCFLVCFVLNLLNHLHLLDLALEGQCDPCLTECPLCSDFFVGLSFYT